jgi:succinate dehydrogenase/fumarate reductase-like Fe-S protein
MTEGGTIKVRIRRAPEDRMDEYAVPYQEGMSVFNAIDLIRNELDPTLCFLISCRIGKCDICLLKVNGKTRWSCTEPCADGMLLEALDRYQVLKDLVIDWERKSPVAQPRVGAASEGIGG